VRDERAASGSYFDEDRNLACVSVFDTYRVDGPIGVFAGYVLLSVASVLFPYAAPFTAAVLWYRAITWTGSSNRQRAVVARALLVLAVVMTAYTALVVTGIPVDTGFSEGAIR
jgi:hypothetical protein